MKKTGKVQKYTTFDNISYLAFIILLFSHFNKLDYNSQQKARLNNMALKFLLNAGIRQKQHGLLLVRL